VTLKSLIRFHICCTTTVVFQRNNKLITAKRIVCSVLILSSYCGCGDVSGHIAAVEHGLLNFLSSFITLEQVKIFKFIT